MRLLEQLRDPNQAREAEEAEAANVAVKEEKEAEEATAVEKEEKEKKVKQEPVEVEEAIVKDAVAKKVKKGLKVKQVNSDPELDRVKAEAVVEEIDPKPTMLSLTKPMLMRTLFIKTPRRLLTGRVRVKNTGETQESPTTHTIERVGLEEVSSPQREVMAKVTGETSLVMPRLRSTSQLLRTKSPRLLLRVKC